MKGPSSSGRFGLDRNEATPLTVHVPFAARSSSNPPSSEARPLEAFFSYSRSDLEFAERLAAALESRGIDVLIDRRDLPLAIEFQAELLGLIRQADAVVSILTPRSAASRWCAWEIEQATGLCKRLVPVLLEPVEDGAVPDSVRRINYVPFGPGEDFETSSDALARALLTDFPWVKEHTRLAERARVWDEHGRSRAFVLRGKELDDAEAWAARQPAAAPPPTELHREFVRGSRRAASTRQRVWLGAAIAVALTATGLATLAELNRREAVAQRDRAERVVARATDTANALVFDLAHRFRSQIGVPQALIVKSLGLSQSLMEQLASGGETQPSVLRSRSIALMELSTALRAAGELGAARKAAESAVAILDGLTATAPAAIDLETERSAAYDRLGDAAAALGDPAGALRAYETSVSVVERLATANPQDVDLQRNLAVGLEKMADLRAEAGSNAEAIAGYERSREIRLRLAGELDRSADSRRELSVSHEKIGNVLVREARLDEAMAEYRESLELSKRLVAEYPERSDFLRDLGSSCQRIGNALYAQGDVRQALRLYREDLEITTRLAASDPSRPEWQRDLAVSHQKVADALHSNGRLGEALDAYSRSRAILERLAAATSLADDLRLLASCERHSSSLLVEHGDRDRAFRLAERAIARARAWKGGEEQQALLLVEALGNAAWFAVLNRRNPLAVRLADEALARDPGALWVELNRAHALLLGGDENEASRLYLSHDGQAIPGQGGWSDAVLSDFATLRRSGLAHARMDEIEAALRPRDPNDRPGRSARP